MIKKTWVGTYQKHFTIDLLELGSLITTADANVRIRSFRLEKVTALGALDTTG